MCNAYLLLDALQDQRVFDQWKIYPDPSFHTNDIFSFLCSKDCLSVFDVNLNIFHHVSLMILKGKVYRIKQRGQKKGKFEMIRGSEKKDRGKDIEVSNNNRKIHKKQNIK